MGTLRHDERSCSLIPFVVGSKGIPNSNSKLMAAVDDFFDGVRQIKASGSVDCAGLSGGHIPTVTEQKDRGFHSIPQGADVNNTEAKPFPDFIEVTSPDGLRSDWDQDADVAFIRVTGKPRHHGELNSDMDTLLEYDEDGALVGVQFLYCADGVTLQGVPEGAGEKVRRTAEAPGISVDEDPAGTAG